MQQTTEQPSSIRANPVKQTGAIAAGNPTVIATVYSRVAIPPRPSELRYTVRLVAITSAVSLTVVLLGQGLWQSDTKAARLPGTEGTGVNHFQPASLRDRLQVMALRSNSLSPLESTAPFTGDAYRQAQSRQAPGLPVVHVSQGFGNGRQPSFEARLPVPILPQIPEQPTLQSSQSTQAPTHPADPSAVVATLLQPAQPYASRTATPPQPETTAGSTVPQTAVASATDYPQQLASTASPEQPNIPTTNIPTTNVPTEQVASVIPITTTGQALILQTGIQIEPLIITGNTQFSTKELAEVVQKALMATAGRSLSHPNAIQVHRLSLMELMQVSRAITNFYLGHGYVNAKVSVPIAMTNGATPAIQIVEGIRKPMN